MQTQCLGALLRHLNRQAQSTLRTDAELLRAWKLDCDAAAFDALVNRHALVVWRACRRVLGHDQDAEDAFQTTFFVLARKPPVLGTAQSLAPWLYGVACRAALQARRGAARRRAHERNARPPQFSASTAEIHLRELEAILDEEVRRLAEPYRLPFVLCCLEGFGKAEAARLLGWKEGTLSGRLARARDRLRQRLLRRGVTFSAALTATALGAADAAPAALVRATVASASRGCPPTASRAGVLADSMLKKAPAAKLASAVLLMTTVLAGATALGALSRGFEAEPPPLVPRPMPSAEDPGARPAAADLPLPEGAVARLGTQGVRHGGMVQDVAFSPDGKLLASAGLDGDVRLWDATSRRHVRKLGGHFLTVYAVAFAKDGRTLQTLDWKGIVRQWDVDTGRELLQHEVGGHPFAAAAFSENGAELAAATLEGRIILWDLKKRRVARAWQGHEPLAPPLSGQSPITRLAILPDGKTLVSAGMSVRIWDMETGKLLHEFKTNGRAIDLAVSPAGDLVAISGFSKGAYVWEVASGKQVAVIDNPQNGCAVGGICFSPDGKSIATGSARGLLCQWELPSGKLLRRLEGRDNPSSLAFRPDGQAIAVGSYHQTVSLWNLDGSKEPLYCGDPPKAVTALALSRDCRTLAVGENKGIVTLWDMGARRILRTLDGRENAVYRINFAGDGRTLFSGARQGQKPVIHWDVATGKELRRFEQGCLVLGPSPTGLMFTLTSDHDTTRICDLATGRQLAEFPGNRSPLASADGRTVAVDGYVDNTSYLLLRDVATGKELCRLSSPNQYYSTAFSPDGRSVTTSTIFDSATRKGPLEVTLWEVATGQIRRRFTVDGVVSHIAVSPDGRTMASYSPTDMAIAIWDLHAGKRIAWLRGHGGPVEVLLFTPDSQQLYSGSDDGTVMIWDVARQWRGQPAPEVLGSEKLERHWRSLNEKNAEGAYAAIGQLIADPGRSVPFLRQRLLAEVPAVDLKHLAKLFRDLDSDQFAEREAASQELEKIGETVVGGLRRQSQENASAEVRRRAADILSRLESKTPPDRLRLTRALEGLEAVGNSEAVEALKELVKRAPDSWLATEAQASLFRMVRARSTSR